MNVKGVNIGDIFLWIHFQFNSIKQRAKGVLTSQISHPPNLWALPLCKEDHSHIFKASLGVCGGGVSLYMLHDGERETHGKVGSFVWSSQLQKTLWGVRLDLRVQVRTSMRLTAGLRKLELKHVCAVSPRSLSHRYAVKVSESQEIWVEVVQLEDTGQQEGSRKQNPCKQLHRVVPFQAQVSKTGSSHNTMCNIGASVCKMWHFCLLALT